MSDKKELTVSEPQPPQQLITIEPKKYVELVFEPFAKRLADAKTLAEAATFDVTTTAGMAIAVKHRATFRDIRVASEKARKERKAPILEIGKLLDSRQKEIEAEIEPYESRFDDAIKAEEARKEAEKAAKAAAEKARVDGIRQSIDGIRAYAANAVGRTSAQIAAMIEAIESVEITLDTHQEFAGEAEMAKVATVAKLREMLAAQQAHEAEQARLAEERAQLERERAEAAERERQAAAARAEQERKAREAREAEESLLRAQRETQEAELRKQREAEETRLRAEREAEEAKLAAQRAEIARQQAEIDRQRAEAERFEREAREAAAAAELARQIEADHAEALSENERIDRERAEAKRRADEAYAAEQDRIRRALAEFEATGPEDWEIAQVIADHYDVTTEVARHWLARHVWMEKAA